MGWRSTVGQPKMNNSKLQAGLHELQETGAFDFIVHRYRADGATCLAISGDNIDMTQIGFALAKYTEAFREATEHFPKARQVSMVGHGRVHYWPDVPYDPAIVAAVREDA
jgi:hypothetical protein